MRTLILLLLSYCLLLVEGPFVTSQSAVAQEPTKKPDAKLIEDAKEENKSSAEPKSEGAGTAAKSADKSNLAGFERAHHPWARFKAGAWRTQEVITEKVDERGDVTGVSTTTSTQSLDKVGKSEYTIRVDATQDVQNKLFRSAPSWVTSGFLEEGPPQATEVSPDGEGSVTIEGRKFPCQIIKVVVPGEKKTLTTHLYFNSKIYPFILRRETAITDDEGLSPPVKISERVIALDMPFRLLSETLLTSHIRSERKGPKGTTVTLSIHSPRAPGGVVASWSKELDSESRTIRRIMLELTDYDLEPEIRVRRRRRNRRSELDNQDERISDRRGTDRREEERDRRRDESRSRR